MPFGKARERRRGRKADSEARDPESTEAYEHGWYALLARQAEDEGNGAVPPAGPPGQDEAPRPEGEDPEASSTQLATVTPLLVPGPLRHPSQIAARSSDAARSPEALTEIRDAAAAERPSIRIGVRRLEDPDTVYLRYLTDSSHRDFFRGDWWPSSRTITPVHLWRANHLGAGWDMERIERFMLSAAQRADEMIAAAPRGDLPGSPDRRAWMRRFLTAEWVQEFGIGRLSKSLCSILPDLVPDLDLTMQPWAAERWLGLERPGAAEEPFLTLERWELIEDVLILRGPQLEKVAGRLRRLAPGLAPVGRLGVIVAAFWEGYWADLAARAARRRPAAPRPPKASGARKPRAAPTTAGETVQPTADEATPAPAKAPPAKSSPRRTPRARRGVPPTEESTPAPRRRSTRKPPATVEEPNPD
jgi:hypothetical protein